MLQIAEDEVFARAFSQPDLVLQEFYAELHILIVQRPVDASGRPEEEVIRVYNGQKRQPEPNEDEDFFVDEIYGQHTLHGVLVDFGGLAHLKVTHGHAREINGIRVVLAMQYIVYDLEAV